MTNVGLSVVKGVANAVTPAVLPDTNAIGLLFRRSRGVPNKAHIYGSVSEDVALFGGSKSGLLAPEVVKNLFDNAAGAPVKLHGVRVVADDAVAATATVTDSGSGFTLDLVAAYEGEEDPGAWLNDYEAVVGIESSENTDIAEPYFFELKNPDGDIVETLRSTSWEGLVAAINSTSKYVMTTGTPTPNSSTPSNIIPIPGATNETFDIWGNGRSFHITVQKDVVDVSVISIGRKIYYSGSPDVFIGSIRNVSATLNSGTIFMNFGVRADEPGYAFGNPANLSELLVAAPSIGTAVFSGGSDGTESESDFYSALAALESYYVKVVGVVDTTSITMCQIGQSWAKDNGSFFVSVLPFQANESLAEQYKQTFRNALEPALGLYNLWVKVYSPAEDGQIWVPGIGAILGAGFIRVPANNNDLIHTPPAGVGSAILGISEAFPKNLTQTQINTYVQDRGINVARFQEGLGYYLASSRTVSSNPLYHSIHTILQANFYRKVLQDSLAWTEQQPITTTFDSSVVGFLNAFFSTEYENGALETSISFGDACVIISGAAINPPSQDRKIRNFEVQYIPTEASESVVIRLNRNDGSLIVN